MQHPENSEELNSLIEMVEGASMMKVFCHGCQQPREMNSAYAKWTAGGISSCRFCRDDAIRARNMEFLNRSFDLPAIDSQMGQ
jgi:hypothetical protein